MEIFFGSRPEFAKIKPLLPELDKVGIDYTLVFTGQQPDLVKIPKNLDCKIIEIEQKSYNRLDSLVINILENSIEDSSVLIQGDTATAFAVAQKAFHDNKTIIHLEAGLRTWNKESPYPEEVYRQFISSVADVHLCPTKLNYNNLIQEKRGGVKYIVGNTALDNLVGIKISNSNKIIVTMHRREMFPQIVEWFKEIEHLAFLHPEYDFKFYAHPNPVVQENLNIFNHVKISKPIEHDEMIKELASCFMVIGDSGGLAEESSFLNKRMIVCREFTERPESLGITSILCEQPNYLQGVFEMIKCFNLEESRYVCPFGDGKSSQRIAQILKTGGRSCKL